MASQARGLTELDAELRELGADAVHDLAHQDPELTRADDEHTIARLDDGDGAGLQRRPTRARHQDDLTLRLEHLAQRLRRRLQHALVEGAIVLDRRRLVPCLDDARGQLGAATTHEQWTPEALRRAERYRHDVAY